MYYGANSMNIGSVVRTGLAAIAMLTILPTPAPCQKREEWVIGSLEGTSIASVLVGSRSAEWGLGVFCRKTDGELEARIFLSALQSRLDSLNLPGFTRTLWYQFDTPGGLDDPPFPADASPQSLEVDCVQMSRCLVAGDDAWELVRPLATEDHRKVSFDIVRLQFPVPLKKAREVLSELPCVQERIAAQ
jgi:hypothetical protein